MSLYLSWLVVPYTVSVIMLLAALWCVFKGLDTVPDTLKRQRRVLKVVSLGIFVFFVQFPWQYSTPYYKQLTFDNDILHNDQQIERQEGRESWEEWSNRTLLEAKQNADKRTEEALDE